MMKDAVAIFSGGMDSTTLVYNMIDNGYRPHLLSFDYGQRHKKELDYARGTAELLGLRHDIIDLTGITHLISNSALTSQPHKPLGDSRMDELALLGELDKPAIEVPEGHYAEDNMALTVVPNRNMIMLSIACGVAVNEKAKTIGTGVHAGDHYQYPDCRPEFVFAAGQTMMAGNKGFHNFIIEGEEASPEAKLLGFTSEALPIYAPFLSSSKADIAFEAMQLGVPFENTWSCYKGFEKHCGRCGTCVERLEAIDEAQQRWRETEDVSLQSYDRTEYADKNYWKQVTSNVPDTNSR